MSDKPEIIAYITSDRERIISGDPLCLYITDETAKQQIVSELGRALRANAIQLKNGDYIVMTDVR